MEIEPLSVEEVEYLAHQLAKKFMAWNEPIPDFSTRFPEVLERCLMAPHQTFAGQLYKGLIDKAAILFYLLIKNHPLQNGNKRVAVTTLLLFLYKSQKWLRLDNQQLYNFAKWVAESDPNVKEQTVAAIQHMLKTHMVNL